MSIFNSFKRSISLWSILEFYLTLAIPLIYLLGLFIISRFPQTLILPIQVVITGLILIIPGIVFWAVGMLHLGSSFGTLPKRQHKVVKGVYKYIRHPIYLGISLTYIGLSLANQSKQGFFFTFSILIPMLIIRASIEERFLFP